MPDKPSAYIRNHATVRIDPDGTQTVTDLEEYKAHKNEGRARTPTAAAHDTRTLRQENEVPNTRNSVYPLNPCVQPHQDASGNTRNAPEHPQNSEDSTPLSPERQAWLDSLGQHEALKAARHTKLFEPEAAYLKHKGILPRGAYHYREESSGQNEYPDLSLYTAKQYPNKIPDPPQQVVKGLFERAAAHLHVGAGGVGKTQSLLDLAVKISLANYEDRGRLWMGREIADAGKAVLLLSEDDDRRIQRRLWRMYPDGEWRNNNLIVLPLVSLGLASRPLLHGLPTGEAIKTKMWNHLRERLADLEKIALIAFDPLQKLFALNLDSDSQHAQFAMTALGELATETDSCTIGPHHVSKSGLNVKTIEEARTAIRGVTALVDGSRLAHMMWQVETKEAERIVEQLDLMCEPHDVVRSAVVKDNLEGTNKRLFTLTREPSGQFVDRSQRVKEGVSARNANAEADVWRMMKEFLGKSERRGVYYTRTSLAKTGIDNIGCGHHKAAGFIAAFLGDGRLVLTNHPDGTRRKGEKVVRIPAAMR